MVRWWCGVSVMLLLACGEDSSSDSTSATGAGGQASGGGGMGVGASSSSGGAGGTAGGGGTGGDGSGPDCNIGTPLTVPDLTWTTVRSTGTVCGNAGEAGFVVNPSPTSKGLLIYFSGGGACFSQSDCTASLLGGFSDNQGVALASGRALFDRTDAANPFADWDFVFVPYCTGDFHAGDNVPSYGVRHRGYSNMVAHLETIVPTFCDADHVVVTGTSAGGYGALLNYAHIHAHYDNIPVDLVSDSGPFLTPAYMSLSFQDLLEDSWQFRQHFPSSCQGCDGGGHALYTHLAERWPEDRLSVITNTRDPTIQSRLEPYTPLDDLDAYEEGLDVLADDVLGPLANFRVFYRDAEGHVLLGGAALAKSQNGVTLGTFITQQVTDDPDWSDVRP